MLAEMLARAMGDGTPWDLHEARRRRHMYTGLWGPDHKAALAKGYVDLGLVDPEIILNPENSWERRFAGTIAGHLAYILIREGVAWVRDPEGLVEKLHIDPQRVATLARGEIGAIYHDQSTYDAEAEDWDSETYRLKVADAVRNARVVGVPVQGRTGPGYKFVMKPSVQEIEKSLGPRRRSRP